jgi:hypothetical protein
MLLKGAGMRYLPTCMRNVTTVKMAVLGGNDYRNPKYKDLY